MNGLIRRIRFRLLLYLVHAMDIHDDCFWLHVQSCDTFLQDQIRIHVSEEDAVSIMNIVRGSS